jgi:hypothetical protein
MLPSIDDAYVMRMVAVIIELAVEEPAVEEPGGRV